VSIIDIDLHRNDFTQHGLHLNTTGKEKVAEMIARNIKQPRIKKKKDTPIPIDKEENPKDAWPELHETTTYAETNKNSASDTVPDRNLHSL
jgi:hypothetical protein